MRPPIQSTARQWLTLMPFFFVIGVCLILVMNETANPITSTKNISGWVTRVNDRHLVRIQETKPEKKIRYSKFGPINLPPASSVHDLQIKPELARVKVGDRISVRVNCLGKDTIFDFSNVCTVEDVSVGQ